MPPTPSRGHALTVSLASALAIATLPGSSAAGTASSSDPGTDQDGVRVGAVEHYVALGDSFTAGPFIPPVESDPTLCMRSGNSYPSAVADALGATELTDVSCSMADIAHMTSAQPLGLGTENPPQFDALRPDTDLVTVGIGGNDFGFLEVLLTCAALGGTDRSGAPCREHYTGDGGDTLQERLPSVGQDVATVLEGIRERSPDATIAVVGYLQVLPEDEGCWPQAPIARGDVAYLDQTQSALNEEIEKRANEAGARFVDVFERGHDICAERSRRWVEGVFPSQPTAPAHPTRAGMDATAERVLSTLRDGNVAPLR